MGRREVWTRLCVLAGGAGVVGLSVAGLRGAISFALLAIAAAALMDRVSAARARRRERSLGAALAPCADLLAACLHAGATVDEAVASVASTLEGPLHELMSRVAVALRAGSDPARAWALDASLAPLAPVARAFVRASRSGAPLAATMSAVADEQRRMRRWEAEAAARRAGVLAVAPLVVCFLPAFILVGVVPVVLGIAAQALTSL
jgi:pilus assembly protein TadC